MKLVQISRKKNGFSRNRFKMIQTKKWRLDRKYFTCDFKWLIVHELHGRQRHSMPDQALGFKVARPLASFIQNPCANCGAKTCTSSEILWNLVKLNGCYSHHLSSLSQAQCILWNEDFSGNRHGAEAEKAMWHSLVAKAFAANRYRQSHAISRKKAAEQDGQAKRILGMW